jgi:hypothetical protein
MLYCENANDHGILIRTGQANSVMRPSSTSLAIRLTGNRAVSWPAVAAPRGSWKTWFVSFGWRCQGDRTTVAVISHADCLDRSALSRWRDACEVFAHERVIGLRLRTAPSGRSRRRRLRRGPDGRGETRPSFAAVHESAPGTKRTFHHLRSASAIGAISHDKCSLRVFRSLTQLGHERYFTRISWSDCGAR